MLCTNHPTQTLVTQIFKTNRLLDFSFKIFYLILKFLSKTAHAGMISSEVSCKERQKLDVCKELTSTTGCRGRGLNRRPPSPWASTLPLSYPA